MPNDIQKTKDAIKGLNLACKLVSDLIESDKMRDDFPEFQNKSAVLERMKLARNYLRQGLIIMNDIHLKKETPPLAIDGALPIEEQV